MAFTVPLFYEISVGIHKLRRWQEGGDGEGIYDQYAPLINLSRKEGKISVIVVYGCSLMIHSIDTEYFANFFIVLWFVGCLKNLKWFYLEKLHKEVLPIFNDSLEPWDSFILKNYKVLYPFFVSMSSLQGVQLQNALFWF